MLKKICLIAMVLFSSAAVFAQAPYWAWAQKKGDVSADLGFAIAVDDSDNVYTTGGFEGVVDFDAGPGVFNLASAGFDDIFISKTDSAGNLVWAKRVGSNMGLGPGWEMGYGIALNDAGNVYVTGHFAGTVDFDPDPVGTYNLTGPGVFVLKLNGWGNFVWARAMATSFSNYHVGKSIALDGSGNVYTSGSFSNVCDFDPDTSVNFIITAVGSNDIFISKLDSAGNFVWAKSFEGQQSNIKALLTVDVSGNVYTTGELDGTIDFDPSPAVFNLTSAGSVDIFMCKLDASGSLVWANAIGGAEIDLSEAIVADNSGSFYITGGFEETVDFDPDSTGAFSMTAADSLDIFVAMYDTAGNFVWAKQMGGTNDELATSIALDQAGDIYTAGTFRSIADFDPDTSGAYNLTSAGFTDFFVSNLDNAGNFGWAKSIEGTSYEGGGNIYGRGTCVAAGSMGNAFMMGNFASANLSVGPFNLANANSGPVGTYDIFVAKINSSEVAGNDEMEGDNKRFLLFPNPSAGLINITGPSIIDQIEITDVMGRVVYRELKINSEKLIVNCEQWEGIYFVRLTAGEEMVTKKVVVGR